MIISEGAGLNQGSVRQSGRLDETCLWQQRNLHDKKNPAGFFSPPGAPSAATITIYQTNRPPAHSSLVRRSFVGLPHNASGDENCAPLGQVGNN